MSTHAGATTSPSTRSLLARLAAKAAALLVTLVVAIVGATPARAAVDGCYARYDGTTRTLTFFWSEQEQSGDDVVAVTEGDRYGSVIPWKQWLGEGGAAHVVFDASCAGHLAPTSTAGWFDEGKDIVSFAGWEHLDTSKTTAMGSMFRMCESLEELVLPESFATPELSDTGYMFGYCKKLRRLELPSTFSFAKVGMAQYMFAYCNSLETLELPESFAATNASDLNGFFAQLGSLRYLKLPSTFCSEKSPYMVDMFGGCANLRHIDFGGFSFPGTYATNRMFDGTTKIETIEMGTSFSPVMRDGTLPLPDVSWEYVAASADATPGPYPVGSVLSTSELFENWDGSTMAGTWSRPRDFKVEPPAASARTVTYDGAAHAPAPVVRAKDGTVLTEGVDFELVWSRVDGTAAEAVAAPTDAGSYTCTVRGLGAYAGSYEEDTWPEFALEIDRRPLTVRMSYQRIKVGSALEGIKAAVVEGLVEGHYVQQLTVECDGRCDVEGTRTVTPSGAVVCDLLGMNEFTSNYQITYVPGVVDVAKEYAVVLDGGEGRTVMPVGEDGCVELPSTTALPAPSTSHALVGWAERGGTVHPAGERVELTDNLVLTPVWGAVALDVEPTAWGGARLSSEASSTFPCPPGTFSADELRAIADGAPVTVSLSASPTTADEALATQLLEPLDEGWSLGQAVELELTARVGDGEAHTISETQSPVTISATLGEELAAEGRSFAVTSVHGGEPRLVESTIEGMTLTFSTSEFSPYGIAWRDADSTSDPDPDPDSDPDPDPDPDPTPGPTPAPTPAPVSTAEMYRLYNPYSGEHFYTASASERDSLSGIGWKYEGVGWKAPAKSNSPVYRLYNAYAGDHHYTTSAAERDQLVAVGWSFEGVGWYSDDARGVPLFRQYNPYANVGTHNYTTSKDENDMLVSVGWLAEGIGWYGVA